MKKNLLLIVFVCFYLFFSACTKHISPAPINDGTPTGTFTPGGPTGTPTNTATITNTATYTMTRTPSITSTPTITNTPNITVYHFETDLEGWIRDTIGGGFTSATHNSDPAYSALGTGGSVKVNCDFYSPYNVGYLTKNLSSPINLTGKTITAYIYVPASLAGLSSKYSAFIDIHSVTEAYKLGPSVTLDTVGWQIIQFSPVWIGTADIDKIRVGLNRVAPDNWTGEK